MGKKRKIRAHAQAFGRKHAQHPISKRLRAAALVSDPPPTLAVAAAPVVEPPTPPEPEPAPTVEAVPASPPPEPDAEVAPPVLPKRTQKRRAPRKRTTRAKTEE